MVLWTMWMACTAGKPQSPAAGPDAFRVALLSDPHITASDYVCCESPGLDTESISLTRDRLIAAQDQINAIQPAPEFALLAGDIFHQNYKHPELADYLDRETAAGNAATLLDRFVMPAYPAWGNHDYEVPEYPKELSHGIFKELFDKDPYYAVESHGWKFLLTNSQLGRTWDPLDAMFDTGLGSFGAEQLAWIDAELAEGMPTFIIFHHPLIVVEDQEEAGGPIPGIISLMEKHGDTIAAVFVGHTHRWIDFTTVTGIPNFVLAATRYDPDNFWILELEPQGTGWQILDKDKAVWLTVDGKTYDYAAGAVVEDPEG